jgi:hypothetical protein
MQNVCDLCFLIVPPTSLSSEAMYDIADTASILAMSKMLEHTFVYLGIDPMYDLIQTFLEEGMFAGIYRT